MRIHVDDLRGHVDFAIITILEEEFVAILDRFALPHYAQRERRYEIGEMQTEDHQHYRYAVVRCATQGSGEGQSVAQDVIKDLDPKLLILVGIGGGVPSGDFTLGDVVCATRVHDFCVSATSEGVPETFNVGGGDMHVGIRNLLGSLPKVARMLGDWNTAKVITNQCPEVRIPRSTEEKAETLYGDVAWQKHVIESLNRHFPNNSKTRLPRCTAQAIASSDRLVKGTSLLQQWKEAARALALVEMELAGVYKAARKADREYPILAIRGISDIVGFKRKDDWKTFACEMAASFASALVRSGELRDIIGPRAVAGGRGSARRELADLGVAFNYESLFTQIRSGNANIVRLLLRAGLSPNVDLEGRTPLQEALRVIDQSSEAPFTEDDYRLDILKALITADEPPRDLSAAAHSALSTQSRLRLTALLRGGVPLDIADHHGIPLISKAIAMDEDNMGGSPSWVELLVKEGTLLQGHWAARVIVWAGMRGTRSAIELMLARGYPVNGRVDSDPPTHLEREAELKLWWPGGTALHQATPRGADYVLPFLAAGVDLTARDQLGKTPLQIAVANCHPDSVHALLEAGSDPNVACTERHFLDDLFKCPDLLDVLLERGLRIDPAAAGRFLTEAVYRRDLKILQLLLDSGGAIEARDEYGLTPLLCLCNSWEMEAPCPSEYRERRRQQSFDCLALLIRKGADPNSAYEGGFSPLHLLAQVGEATGMRQLLEAGADIQATDRYGRTVLHLCATPAAASVCLEAGLSVSSCDYRGYTPLDHAVMYDRRELAEHLCQQVPGARPDASAGLIAACRRGNVAGVRRMLGEGLSVTTVDGYGDPLLHIAADMGHTEVVETLLDAGADINARNQNGTTVLYSCLRSFSIDCLRLVTLLLDRGASPENIDGHGASAVYEEGAWIPELAKRLIEICPRLPKRNGATLTMLAAKFGQADLVRHTLQSGEDVNAVDVEGRSALFYPVTKECEEVYRVLLKAGARVDLQDHRGNTALMRVVDLRLWPGVSLLLEYGADPTLANNEGETALHKSIQVGDIALFRLLRDRGQLSRQT